MISSIELKQVTRSLRRSPVFTITVVATLALGIGATAAVFSLVNAVLLRPLPFRDAGRLVSIAHTLPGLGIPFAAQSRGTYFHYRRTTHTLQAMAAYKIASVNIADVAGTGEAERAHAAFITASLLPTLGVMPGRGRAFSAGEDLPNGDHVVLIGDGLWRRRFAADPKVLDRTLRVDGVIYRVIGVMPAGFDFPRAPTDLWLPLQLDPRAPHAESFAFGGVARLAPDVDERAAERELNTLLARLPESYPDIYPGLTTSNLLAQSQARAVVKPLRDAIVGDFARVLWIVAATVVLVLVVTCANVINLLLVRAQGKTRETAVRTALGASRGRLLTLALTEGCILAAAGGVIGIALAALMTKALLRAGPTTIPRWEEIHLDAATIAFTIGIVAIVALTCSAVPAARYRSVRLGPMLREGGRTGTSGREQHRAQRALIVVQVALALLLLAGSGLLARTVWKLRSVTPGFDPAGTLAFTLSLPPAEFRHLGDVSRFYRTLVERLRTLPSVEKVGVVSKLPLVGGAPLVPVYVERFPIAPGALPKVFPFPVASAGYFGAMRIAVVAGRLFAADYAPKAPPEVVISRAFAEEYWHDPTGQRALGQRLRVSSSEAAPWSTIVGVVESVRDTSLAAAPLGAVYTALRVPDPDTPDSLAPFVTRDMNVVLRSAGDPLTLAALVRRTVQEMNPTIPVYDVQPMTEVLDRATARTRFALLALGVAATITLALGGIGLYGVIAYVVSLRTRELGLRMALGAQPALVRALVLREGLALAAVGILSGLVAFAALSRFLRGLLFEVSAGDPWTLAGVIGSVTVVAILASWLPARRASRIDPLEALRAD